MTVSAAMKDQTNGDAGPDCDRAIARQDAPVLLVDRQSYFLCPARGITPAVINLMATHARGLICHVMDAQQMLTLGLTLLPVRSQRPNMLRFATSYEAVTGCSTGISCHDRAHTLNVAAAAGACARDICTPGHVIPILASPAGNTAADRALALVAQAGRDGGAVICAVLDPAGDVARPEAARALARQLDLRVV